MLSLALSVLCSVVIANLLMVFNRKGGKSILPVFLGNYLMAAGFSFFALPVGTGFPKAFDLLFGILSGAFFLFNFLVYQRNILINGMSLSVSVMRVAMIVPIVASLIIFQERIGAWNVCGIVLAIGAFLLRTEKGSLHNLFWLLGLFAVSGATDLSLKIFKEFGSGSEPLYVFIIFSSAFIFTLILIFLRRELIPWQGFVFGLVLGLPNRFSTVFFLRGLDSVPAAIAYPITAIGVVLVSLLSDIVFWKRRLNFREALMYSALTCSILLLNI